MLDNQGQAYFALGDYERAEKIYLQTLEEANEQDEPRQKSYVLPSLARALAAQDRTREAYARFSEALTVALHAGEHTQLLTIINCIAELMADEGETNKALELVRFVVVNELVDSGDKQRAEVLIEKLVNEPELRLNPEIKTTNEQIISLAKNLIPLLNERSAETQEDGYPH